jgi:hypothetical protein
VLAGSREASAAQGTQSDEIRPSGHLYLKKSSNVQTRLKGTNFFLFFLPLLLFLLFELRALLLVGKHSYHLSHASSPFALLILEIGSCFLSVLVWTMIRLFRASHSSWDDRCEPPCLAFLPFRLGSLRLSPELA